MMDIDTVIHAALIAMVQGVWWSRGDPSRRHQERRERIQRSARGVGGWRARRANTGESRRRVPTLTQDQES